MKYRESIINKLQSLSPSYLEVIDESYMHFKHSGYSVDGETHFRIIISSVSLDGLSKIEQHRTINHILKEELSVHVHALSIKVL